MTDRAPPAPQSPPPAALVGLPPDPWRTGLQALLVLDGAAPALEAALAEAISFVDGAAAAAALDQMTRLVRGAESALRLASRAAPQQRAPDLQRALGAAVARLTGLSAVWVPAPLGPLRQRLRRAGAELAVAYARLSLPAAPAARQGPAAAGWRAAS